MNKDVLDAKSAIVDEHIAYLERFKGRRDLDKTESLAVRHALQEIIEACLAIASHIVAAHGFEEPNTNAALFSVLARNSVVSEDLCESLAAMVKMRNVIVHRYDSVDMERVHRAVEEDLDDAKAFLTAVYNFVDDRLNR